MIYAETHGARLPGKPIIACGGIGGSLADNGALAVGLIAEGEGGHPAVAYITPLGDGARSSLMVFVTITPEAGS